MVVILILIVAMIPVIMMMTTMRTTLTTTTVMLLWLRQTPLALCFKRPLKSIGRHPSQRENLW